MKKDITKGWAASLVLSLSLALSLQAQNEVDALRYSRTKLDGTARSIGAGNAMGALGGDFASLQINPAGLGIYRRSEFTASPAIVQIRHESTYLDRTHSPVRRFNLNLSNLGLVLTKMNTGPKGGVREQGWVSFNFAAGFNRVANFHGQQTFAGFNSENSLLDRFVQEANADGGTPPGEMYEDFPFGAGLAYQTYLLSPESFDPNRPSNDSTKYYSEVENGNVRQHKIIESKGGISEWNLSFSANVSNKLYMGIGLGIPFVRYTETSRYEETDVEDVHPNFNAFVYKEELEVRGEGVNFKAGVIYRLSKRIRLGASIESPTYYSLRESFKTAMDASLDTAGAESFDSPEGTFSYNLSRPWRATGSLAMILGKRGFISVDYEYRDYSQASFDFDLPGSQGQQNEDAINATISERYDATHHVRVGGELRIEQYRLRAGYNFDGSPFMASPGEVGADYAMHTFSFGGGLRKETFFLDLAVVSQSTQSYHGPYTLDDQPTAGALTESNFFHLVSTIGFTF